MKASIKHRSIKVLGGNKRLDNFGMEKIFLSKAQNPKSVKEIIDVWFCKNEN